MLVEHCKTSTKMTLSGKIVHGAEKDLVETRSIGRLRSNSPKKENRWPIFEKLPKRLSRKIKVEIDSEGEINFYSDQFNILWLLTFLKHFHR